jgi:hypothetical protein
MLADGSKDVARLSEQTDVAPSQNASFERTVVI